MRFINKISQALLLILLIIIFLSGCAAPATSKIKIITSTSLLSYISEQVGGDKVDVVNIIPPAQHPGDFNVKPGDVEKLNTARLFLLLGNPGEKYADKFIASVNNSNLTVVKANVSGNWMIPSVQTAATDRVAGVLGQIDASNNATYVKAANEYKQRISIKEKEITTRLAKANVSKINVLASNRQADFLKWAGLNVIEIFGAPETLTPQTVKDLVDKGKSAKVSLIVNNLQDGKDAGKAIAAEIGAKQINLSNFPGGFDNTETWEKALDYNVDLIIKAVTQ